MTTDLQTKDADALLTVPGLPCLDFKAEGEDRIEGYGAIFETIDQGYDIIEPGAFADSLKSDRKVKFLWQHNPYEPIGVWDSIKEDAKGLRVKGRILSDVGKGREALALLKSDAIDGLSIGYRTIEWREAKQDDRYVRIIEKAELWEVSVVTFQMHAGATVDVKSAADMSRKDFERHLLSHSQMSRKVVGALMGGGFKGVQALSNSGGGDLTELIGAMDARIASKRKIMET